jgi:hypothetical protein
MGLHLLRGLHAARAAHSPETAEKLVGSFRSLKSAALGVLGRDGIATTIPSCQAVDFLRRAGNRKTRREAVSAIRTRVLEEGAALPSIVRQFRDVVFPVTEREQKSATPGASSTSPARCANS